MLTDVARGRIHKLFAFIVFGIFLSISVAFPVKAQIDTVKNKISVLILKDFPPQFVSTPDGPSGLAVDVIREVARRVSLDIDFVTVNSWPEVYPLLKNRSVNALANLGISESRRKIVEFTEPYEVFGIKLFVRAETTDIETFDDLNGRMLGLLGPNVLTKGLVQSGKYDTRIYKSFQAMLVALLAGEIDAMPAPTEPFLLIARAAHLDNRIQPVGPSLLEVKRAIAVPKGQTELRDLLNKGLAEFKRTDDYRKMLAKWYGKPTPYWDSVRISILTGSILVLSLSVMGGWRYVSMLRLSRRLQDSEQRFKDFARTSADWLWETDEEHRYTFISDDDETRVGTGLKKEHVLGKKRTDLVPEEIAREPEKWAKHKADIDAHRVIRNFQYSIVTPMGGVREYAVRADPIFDDNGTFRGYRGVTTDVTERQSLENQLRQAQKMEVVGQLTGGIAHDFNNMLSIVMGNIGLLRKKVAGDQKALELVEEAYQGTVRGADITRKLLSFSRSTSQRPRLMNVNEIIIDMESLVAKSLTAKIAVESHLADDIWTVRIALGDLEDTLLNLALNARDAMPEGGTLKIETANKTIDDQYVVDNPGSIAGDYVMISISDTGSGMTPDTIEKIYQPFFTTKSEGHGTGLGLSMVYGFVQRSGGHIKVISEPGAGTTFQLYLPRAIESENGTALSQVEPHDEQPSDDKERS